MNNLTNALPIMVNNYAKLFGVSVRIQGTVAYTNGKTITIPRLDINNPVKARLAYGYLAHEAAHIRHTDFKLLGQKPLKDNFLLFSLFNILEDNRIETLISREYIGVYENLLLLNSYYESDWQKFLRTLNSVNVINVLLSYIQCYSQCQCQNYIHTRKKAAKLYFHLRQRMSCKALNTISGYVKKCAKSKNSHEVLSCCNSIYELISDDNFLYKDDSRLDPYSLLDDDRNRLMFEDLKATPGLKENSERFLLEYLKFRKLSGDDIANVTPSKNGAVIIQANSSSESSSSRDDFGVICENECDSGRADFITEVNGTYGLRNALSTKVRGYVEALENENYVGTVINPLKAQLIGVGERKIFKDKTVQREFKTSVHILVDVSSSMLSCDGGDFSRCQEACKVALTLALALEGIDGIYTMATYFPGKSSEYEVALRANEKASLFAPRFDQKPRGSTPLAQALWYAFEKSSVLNCSRNIILVITDGMPDSVPNVKNCFAYARENHIEIYGISIRSEFILKIFENASVIDSVAQLQNQAFFLLNSLFSTKKLKT